MAKNGTSLGAAGSVISLINGTTLTFADSAVSVSQVVNLGITALAPVAGGSITYNAARINGGELGAGNQILGNATRLDGVRVAAGAAVAQTSGTAALNSVIFTGNSTFAQAAGATLNTTGELTANPQTAVTINGVVTTAGGSLSGGVTINSGGRLATAGGPLFLDGTRGTTVNAGGTLSTAAGGTIELGGLLVNNGTHSGVLNVNFGGLARGAGTFGTVNLNDGGRFSLGNSPGSMSAGSMTWGPGGTYVWEINDAVGAAGTNWDLSQIAGTLAIASGSTPGTRFTLELTSLNSSNLTGPPANLIPGQTYHWPIATANSIAGFDPNLFTLDASHFATPGSFTLAQSGNSLVLSFTPAPEPQAILCLIAGVSAIGACLRRMNCPGLGAAGLMRSTAWD